MTENKHYIVDERILKLAEILKAEGQIVFRKEMFDAVEISKQKVNNVRSGGESFTVKQVEAICKKFNADMNWIFGFQDENPFLDSKRLKQKLKQKPQNKAIINVSGKRFNTGNKVAV